VPAAQIHRWNDGMSDIPNWRLLRHSRRAQTMAKRLTDGRKKTGLSVDQIYHWLVEQRMSEASPKKTRLWIGTVRKWFHYGLEEIPPKFRDDFARLCRLLKIQSVDDLWIE
jgi:hypothetical protein